MKKIFLVILTVAVGATSWAQQPAKTKPAGKPAKPVTPATTLKTVNDSASYAIGVSVASFYKQQGITSINTAILSKAISDVMGGKKALLDDMTCNTVVTKLISTAQEQKSKPTIEEGKAFLAKNKTKPGVKTTASGLQYEVITEGTGVKPLATDSVTVNYKGTLINGTEFDNSYTRGEPITFPLNRVIAGWTEGLQLMSVGSKYKLYIPYTLAYGSNDQGPIPGGSTLIFEVDLLDVKKAQ
ncbi:FKBP-type peptidyl-prolyl cis-trans isomerase [Terrimonas alba]|uniref:FKBP-type peptidyl-prolyl cis-trans isomerase n=1 Tax=Terrimonas alba TaxID=3349636 RepID=UPI0035F3CD12